MGTWEFKRYKCVSKKNMASDNAGNFFLCRGVQGITPWRTGPLEQRYSELDLLRSLARAGKVETWLIV